MKGKTLLITAACVLVAGGIVTSSVVSTVRENQLQTSIDTVKQELEQQKTELLAKIESTRATLEEAYKSADASLKSSLEQSIKDGDQSLRETITAEYKAADDSLQSAIDNLGNKLDQLSANVQNNYYTKDEVDATIEQIESLIKGLETAIQNVSGDVEEVAAELAKQIKRIDKLAEDLANAQADIEKINKELDAFWGEATVKAKELACVKIGKAFYAFENTVDTIKVKICDAWGISVDLWDDETYWGSSTPTEQQKKAHEAINRLLAETYPEQVWEEYEAGRAEVILASDADTATAIGEKRALVIDSYAYEGRFYLVQSLGLNSIANLGTDYLTPAEKAPFEQVVSELTWDKTKVDPENPAATKEYYDSLCDLVGAGVQGATSIHEAVKVRKDAKDMVDTSAYIVEAGEKEYFKDIIDASATYDDMKSALFDAEGKYIYKNAEEVKKAIQVFVDDIEFSALKATNYNELLKNVADLCGTINSMYERPETPTQKSRLLVRAGNLVTFAAYKADIENPEVTTKEQLNEIYDKYNVAIAEINNLTVTQHFVNTYIRDAEDIFAGLTFGEYDTPYRTEFVRLLADLEAEQILDKTEEAIGDKSGTACFEYMDARQEKISNLASIAQCEADMIENLHANREYRAIYVKHSDTTTEHLQYFHDITDHTYYNYSSFDYEETVLVVTDHETAEKNSDELLEHYEFMDEAFDKFEKALFAREKLQGDIAQYFDDVKAYFLANYDNENGDGVKVWNAHLAEITSLMAEYEFADLIDNFPTFDPLKSYDETWKEFVDYFTNLKDADFIAGKLSEFKERLDAINDEMVKEFKEKDADYLAALKVRYLDYLGEAYNAAYAACDKEATRENQVKAQYYAYIASISKADASTKVKPLFAEAIDKWEDILNSEGFAPDLVSACASFSESILKLADTLKTQTTEQTIKDKIDGIAGDCIAGLAGAVSFTELAQCYETAANNMYDLFK